MKDKRIKIVLYITFIPYIIMLLISCYHSIFGYNYSHTELSSYGIDGFMVSISNVWFYILSNPLALILFAVVLIFQLSYLIFLGKKYIKRILLCLSILCWIIYLLSGIYHMKYGFCDGLFTCNKVYGLEALTSSLIWYGIGFTFIPVLPITLIYIIIYIVKVKKNKGV